MKLTFFEKDIFPYNLTVTRGEGKRVPTTHACQFVKEDEKFQNDQQGLRNM